jgi:polar amino acid transport system substrate-binding protein
VEVLKEAFARMRQEIRIEFLPFARAIEMVRSGEADGIFPFALSEERKGFVRFPGEILLTDPGALFVRADSPIVFNGDYATLRNYSFGIQRGTSHGPVFTQALENYGIKVDAAADQMQNVQKLCAGRFDIAVGPRLVLLQAAKRSGKLAEIKLLHSGISDGYAYVGFAKQKNFDSVIQRYDETMRKMRQDGTYDRIFSSSPEMRGIPGSAALAGK